MIKIFAILSEKKIRKDIMVFVASVSFDPFELVCHLSNHYLLVASRKRNVMDPFLNLLSIGL